MVYPRPLDRDISRRDESRRGSRARDRDPRLFAPLAAARYASDGRVALFRLILFPYLRPTLVVAVLFRLIDSIKAFPLIYVLTNGGPGTATEVTNYYAFVESFNFSYWGYGSAIATLMVAGVLLLSWLIGRVGVEAERDD